MKKVLVVDDDPYILMSIEFLMQKNGFEVMVARNGTEALEYLHHDPPELVLLDIMMPDVDGYSICRQIKSTPGMQHIVVVFLSARTAEADIRLGYELGAALYISKPFSTRKLMKQILELTEKG